jgi:hypothetical protein
LSEAQLPALTALVVEDDCGLIGAEAQQVLGKVERGVAKPACTGHAIGMPEHGRFSALHAHLREIHERGPETIGVGDRPIVELRPVGAGCARTCANEFEEARDVCCRDSLR